jgi:hypothetical protein
LTAQVADVRLDGLPDGTKITYDVVPNKGKESAENLQVQRTGSSGNRVDESNGKCGLKPHGYWVAGVS